MTRNEVRVCIVVGRAVCLIGVISLSTTPEDTRFLKTPLIRPPRFALPSSIPLGGPRVINRRHRYLEVG
jgi:hypothetical protein